MLCRQAGHPDPISKQISRDNGKLISQMCVLSLTRSHYLRVTAGHVRQVSKQSKVCVVERRVSGQCK